MLKVKSESEVTQSCPTLWDPMGCSLSGSSIHGILQARVLEWIAISFSRRSSRPRNRTWVFCIAGRRFTIWATRKANWLIILSFMHSIIKVKYHSQIARLPGVSLFLHKSDKQNSFTPRCQWLMFSAFQVIYRNEKWNNGWILGMVIWTHEGFFICLKFPCDLSSNPPSFTTTFTDQLMHMDNSWCWKDK